MFKVDPDYEANEDKYKVSLTLENILIYEKTAPQSKLNVTKHIRKTRNMLQSGPEFAKLLKYEIHNQSFILGHQKGVVG